MTGLNILPGFPMIKTLNAHVPWLLMMFLLTIQSSIAGDVLQVTLISGLDKIIHFFIFGVLGWLMTRGADKSNNDFIKRNTLWLIPLIVALFATLDEFHQSMVPGRFADLRDWLSDFSGAILFMIIYKKKKTAKASNSTENL